MNVLIGENGSGKSTVLEALEILRKAVTMSGENPAIPKLRKLLSTIRVYPANESNPPWAKRPNEPQASLRSSVIVRPANDPQLRLALEKGRGALTARDSIFHKAANAVQRAMRDAFRTAQPSLATMVDALAEIVRAHSP
jgi:energy-coupling factor transporter ATP-binding protein EcfA2